MAQVSKQDFKALKDANDKRFYRMEIRLLELQLAVEAQGLSMRELGLSAEQATRCRQRIEQCHLQIRGAVGIGVALANLGAAGMVECDGTRMTYAELGVREQEQNPLPEPVALDPYDLLPPEPPAEPPPPSGVFARLRARLSSGNGDRAAA